MRTTSKPSRGGLIRLTRILFFICCLSFLLPSCYSVRLTNKFGTQEPDLLNQEDGPYKGFKVHEIDTTLKLSVVDAQAALVEGCPSGAFHTIEYRVTFGGALKSFFTFGRRRTVKVKYVCLKND